MKLAEEGSLSLPPKLLSNSVRLTSLSSQSRGGIFPPILFWCVTRVVSLVRLARLEGNVPDICMYTPKSVLWQGE